MRKKIYSLILVLILTFSMLIPVSATEEVKVDGFKLVNYISLYAEQVYKFGITSVQMKNRALEYMLETNDTNVDNVLKAMFKGMDDYSTYFTKEEYAAFADTVNASLCGIGVSCVMGKNGAEVLDVIPHSPAEKAGIKKYDTLVFADGVSLSGLTLDQAVTYIKGEAGSLVKIGVSRYGESGIKYFDIVRAYIEISPVTWKKLDDETAYLKIDTLTLNSDVFVREALSEIDKLGITKIVLDLRDNPGGYLEATVNICDMLLPEGVVGYEDYKDPGKLETFYSKNKNPKYKLAVLINGNTASGAEFLSGGIQDTKVGVLFGEQSFGKGTVQNTIPLSNGGAIKITVAKYYTAGKQDVAENHINPDFPVENSYKKINEENFEPINFDEEVKVGSVGKAVLAIEQRLSALGYMDEADEEFTEETMDAVRLFKASNNMGTEPIVNFDFIAFINNLEYDEIYYTVDRQLDAAHNYLKGLK